MPMMAALGGFESAVSNKKTLWFGSAVTLFKTRAIARAHIKRTQHFAQEHSLPWSWMLSAYIKPVRRLK
jgi:hypothetical protein